MQISRKPSKFSLLFISSGELPLECSMCQLRITPTTTEQMTAESKCPSGSDESARCSLFGRLFICTQSLVFEPYNHDLPMCRVPFQSFDRFSKQCVSDTDIYGLTSTPPLCDPSDKSSNGIISISCHQLQWIHSDFYRRKFVPHQTGRENADIRMKLIYTETERIWDLIDQLLKSNNVSAGTNVDGTDTLRTVEQMAMIDAIVFSYQRRLSFGPNYIDNLIQSMVGKWFCSLICPMVTIPGILGLTKSAVIFKTFVGSFYHDSVTLAANRAKDGQQSDNYDKVVPIVIRLRDILYIYRRRCQLRPVGLEIIYSSSSSSSDIEYFYVMFETQRDRDRFHDAIVNQEATSIVGENDEHMMQRWLNRSISNYEYLLFLNHSADRSFNDLSQYPTMPWIIADYISERIDLSAPSLYRDLRKPVGALSSAKLRRLLERQQMLSSMQEDHGSGMDFSSKHHLYGSHYSNPAIVSFYLMRQHPEFMLALHGGKFDVPDRMFFSLQVTWNNCLICDTDVKELLPDFFHGQGTFLENKIGCDFGTLSNGMLVGNVKLPPWASSPQEFIKLNRQALESEHVSTYLHHWIDLMFGYKQRGLDAELAFNTFHPMTYEKTAGEWARLYGNDYETRKVAEIQIMEFGQTPRLLFTVPHPRRHPLPSPLHQLSMITATSNGSVSDSSEEDRCCLPVKVAQHRITVPIVACTVHRFHFHSSQLSLLVASSGANHQVMLSEVRRYTFVDDVGTVREESSRLCQCSMESDRLACVTSLSACRMSLESPTEKCRLDVMAVSNSAGFVHMDLIWPFKKSALKHWQAHLDSITASNFIPETNSRNGVIVIATCSRDSAVKVWELTVTSYDKDTQLVVMKVCCVGSFLGDSPALCMQMDTASTFKFNLYVGFQSGCLMLSNFKDTSTNYLILNVLDSSDSSTCRSTSKFPLNDIVLISGDCGHNTSLACLFGSSYLVLYDIMSGCVLIKCNSGFLHTVSSIQVLSPYTASGCFVLFGYGRYADTSTSSRMGVEVLRWNDGTQCAAAWVDDGDDDGITQSDYSISAVTDSEHENGSLSTVDSGCYAGDNIVGCLALPGLSDRSSRAVLVTESRIIHMTITRKQDNAIQLKQRTSLASR